MTAALQRHITFRCGTPLGFNLFQDECRYSVLVLFREIGGFIKGLLQQLGHNAGDMINCSVGSATPGAALQFPKRYPQHNVEAEVRRARKRQPER